MNKRWYFIMGFITSLILIPLLQSLGLPRYSDFLESLFGEQKLLGLIFTISFLVLIGILFTKSKETT